MSKKTGPTEPLRKKLGYIRTARKREKKKEGGGTIPSYEPLKEGNAFPIRTSQIKGSLDSSHQAENNAPSEGMGSLWGGERTFA